MSDITEIIRRELNRKVWDELISQIIYNREPSEGLPDVRPHWPRYEYTVYGDGDGTFLDQLRGELTTKESE